MIKDILKPESCKDLTTDEIKCLIFALYDELDVRREDLPLVEYLDKIYLDSEVKQLLIDCYKELMDRGISYQSLVEHVRYTLR